MQMCYFLFGCTIGRAWSYFPDQGSISWLQQWECRVLTTEPPGDSVAVYSVTLYSPVVGVLFPKSGIGLWVWRCPADARDSEACSPLCPCLSQVGPHRCLGPCVWSPGLGCGAMLAAVFCDAGRFSLLLSLPAASPCCSIPSPRQWTDWFLVAT